MSSPQQPSGATDSPAPVTLSTLDSTNSSSVPEEQPPLFRPKGPPSKPATGKPKT